MFWVRWPPQKESSHPQYHNLPEMSKSSDNTEACSVAHRRLFVCRANSEALPIDAPLPDDLLGRCFAGKTKTFILLFQLSRVLNEAWSQILFPHLVNCTTAHALNVYFSLSTNGNDSRYEDEARWSNFTWKYFENQQKAFWWNLNKIWRWLRFRLPTSL